MSSTWRKSSHSGGNNGNCVELNNTLRAVRDSKNPDVELRVDVTILVDEIRAGRLRHRA